MRIASVAGLLLMSTQVVSAKNAEIMLDAAGDFLIAGSVEKNLCIATNTQALRKENGNKNAKAAIRWQPESEPFLQLEFEANHSWFRRSEFLFTFPKGRTIEYNARADSGLYTFPLLSGKLLDEFRSNNRVTVSSSLIKAPISLDLGNPPNLVAKLEGCLKWLI